MRLGSLFCCGSNAAIDTAAPVPAISSTSPPPSSHPPSFGVRQVAALQDGRPGASVDGSRHRNKSSVVAISALPASVQALHQACSDCGGFDYLRSMTSAGTTVSVDTFCDFCIRDLGMDSSVPVSVLSLLDTSNNIVKVSKLISVLKVIQPLTLLPPDTAEAAAASRINDIVGSQDNHNISILEELADILDVEAIHLHADFARGGSEAVWHQLMKLLNRVAQSRCVRSIPDIKLPQGVNAPYVTARKGSANLGFQVPVWSLRAVHQARPDASAKSGRRGRPEDIPQRRVLQQGDTIATALLRQHLLASGVLSMSGGHHSIPKAVRGQALGLRTVGTDASGLLSLAGERAAGAASARSSMIGCVQPRESHSATFSKCLTKLEHSDSTERGSQVAGEIGVQSFGAHVARASRQGLPAGTTVAEIAPSSESVSLAVAASEAPLDPTRSITDLDGALHEASFRADVAGQQADAPRRPVLASTPTAHIMWADQECKRDSLSGTCSHQDSMQLSPASCPGSALAHAYIANPAASVPGALGGAEAGPGHPSHARHIHVSDSTLSATEQRPLPHVKERDGDVVAAFGLMHAESSKPRVVEPGEAEGGGTSTAVAEGRQLGGACRAAGQRPQVPTAWAPGTWCGPAVPQPAGTGNAGAGDGGVSAHDDLTLRLPPEHG